MKERVADIVRRAELLARVMSGEPVSKDRAAELFGVQEITISRDLQALRELGLQIYSRKHGITVYDPLPAKVLVDLAAEYYPTKLNSGLYRRQINLLARVFPDKFFYALVLCAKAAREQLVVQIEYRRLTDDTEHTYTLQPVKIANRDLNWVLHAFKEGEDILKTFFINRIISIKILRRKFAGTPPTEEESMLYGMRFRFSPAVRTAVSHKLWFEDFSIEEEEGGTIVLTTKQPITNRLAAWCITWWGNIEIIEPVELKTYIRRMIGAFSEKNG